MKLTTAEIDLILKRRARIKRNRKKANKEPKPIKYFTYDKSDYEKKQRERRSDAVE